MTAPFTREPVSDSRKPCPYGVRTKQSNTSTAEKEIPINGISFLYALIELLGGSAEGGDWVGIFAVYKHLKMQVHSIRRFNGNYG